MSMIGNLLRVTDIELSAFLKDSSLLEERIYNEEPEGQDEQLTDIDKTWDGIVFLLTGQSTSDSDHPLIKVLFSGQLVDEDQDLGYGPAHYLTPAQVAELYDQIAGITVADLKLRFDPAKMTEAEVYPLIWDEGDTAFEYIADGFARLQEVFATASNKGEAIVTFIN